MKLIFIDIDGTLHSHKLKKIPESALEAMRLAKAKGHKLVICTGRALASCKQFFDLDVDGFIFGAGSVIYVEKKRIYSHSFTEKQVDQIIQLAKDCHLGICLEADAGAYYNKKGEENIYAYFEKHATAEKTVETLLIDHGYYPIEYRDLRDPIYKICIYGDKADNFKKFSDGLSDDFHGIMMNHEVDQLRLGMELTLKGVNKSTGANKICEYYQKTLDDAIALGDSLNDFEIIRDCGIGIAMGNGHADLKAIADYVTADAAEDGFYKAFKHYNLI